MQQIFQSLAKGGYSTCSDGGKYLTDSCFVLKVQKGFSKSSEKPLVIFETCLQVGRSSLVVQKIDVDTVGIVLSS
jgi:hypothetical protein